MRSVHASALAYCHTLWKGWLLPINRYQALEKSGCGRWCRPMYTSQHIKTPWTATLMGFEPHLSTTLYASVLLISRIRYILIEYRIYQMYTDQLRRLNLIWTKHCMSWTPIPVHSRQQHFRDLNTVWRKYQCQYIVGSNTSGDLTPSAQNTGIHVQCFFFSRNIG